VTTASGVRNDAESIVVERTGKAGGNGRVLAAAQSLFFVGPPRFARASSFARAAFPSASSCSVNGACGGRAASDAACARSAISGPNSEGTASVCSLWPGRGLGGRMGGFVRSPRMFVWVGRVLP